MHSKLEMALIKRICVNLFNSKVSADFLKMLHGPLGLLKSPVENQCFREIFCSLFHKSEAQNFGKSKKYY